MPCAACLGIVGYGGNEVGDAVVVSRPQLVAVAQCDQLGMRHRVQCRRFDLAVPCRFLRIGHESAVLVLLDHIGRVADRVRVVVGPGSNARQLGLFVRCIVLGRKPLALDLVDFLADLPGDRRREIGIVAERPGQLLKRVERFGRTADYFGDLLIRVGLGRFQRCAFRSFAHDTLLGNSRICIAVGRLKCSLVAGRDAAVEPFVLGFQFLDVLIEGIDVFLYCCRFVHCIGYLRL